MPARRIWFRVIVVVLSLVDRAALAQAPGPASLAATVEGNIANKGPGSVTVRLEAVRSSPLGYSDGYTATAAADGAFRFDDVAPGAYRLVAEALVYQRAEFGSSTPEQAGTVLQIKPGEHRTGLVLNLVPDPPTLCGHVTDADGHPLQVTVQVFAATGTGVGLRTLADAPAKLTGKDGSFRFSNLWPQAKYFLRGNGVWYPSSESYFGAHTVEPVFASRSGCTTEIRIPRSRCDGHRVHGNIQGKLERPVFGYDVSLFETNPAGPLFLADSHPLYHPDRFDFDGVCAGSYALVVENNRTQQYFASPVFPVYEADTTVTLAETTQIELHKLGLAEEDKAGKASIQGELRLEGLSWEQACPAAHLGQNLGLMRQGVRQNAISVLDANGHFSFDNLSPGTYELDAGMFLHGAAYVKSFSVDGKTAENRRVALLPGQTSKVEITVSNDPALAEGHPPAGDSAAHYLPNGTHPPASLSGNVTGLIAGAVPVALRAVRFNSGRSMLYETTTASDGSFRFDAVDPGIYVLSTRGDDYQYSAYGAKGPGLEGMPITLSAGQRREGITIASYRRSTLCGRLLDAQGAPQPGWEVWAQAQYAPPKRHAATDADGYFHIPYVGPDWVLLSARPENTRIYYPAGSHFENPQRVDLGPVDSDCALEFRLPDSRTGAAPTYHVRGTVLGTLDPALGDTVYVKLTPENTRSTPLPDRRVERDGSFDVGYVWPGHYTIMVASTYARFQGPRGCSGGLPCPSPLEHILATQQISVGTADINDVRLKMQSLARLTGEILLDGRKPDVESLKKWNLTSRLVKEFRNQAPATVPISVDGRFSIDSLDEGDYSLSINGLWEADYVQAVSVGGKPMEGRRIHLGFGQSVHVVVKLATDGASGMLRSEPLDPPVDPYWDQCLYSGPAGEAGGTLIPDPLPADNSGIPQAASYGVGGHYFVAVPPGRYRIVALESYTFRLGGYNFFQDHEFMLKLAALGRPVEIAPKQSFDLTAPVVTEAVQRLLAEMGVPVERGN
jgi:hypothetical protein